MLFDFFFLTESGIARREKEILFDDRLKIDKHRDQNKQDCGHGEHFPMRARQFLPKRERSLHRFIRSCIGAHRRAPRTSLRLHDFDRAFRQSLHEGAAVWFGHDPIVENHDDASICFSPNESPHALS